VLHKFNLIKVIFVVIPKQKNISKCSLTISQSIYNYISVKSGRSKVENVIFKFSFKNKSRNQGINNGDQRNQNKNNNNGGPFFERYIKIGKQNEKTRLKHIKQSIQLQFNRLQELYGRIETFLKFIITKLLMISGIESNPGPIATDKIKVISCNVRGLRSHYKRKLLFNKIHKLSYKQKVNLIVFLQETHFSNNDGQILDNMLKLSRVDSFGSNRKKGTTIIYNPSNFDHTLEYYNDESGRMNLLVMSKNEAIYIFVNIYAPNDHDIGFFTDLFNLISKIQCKYPGSELVIGGDFNIVLNDKIDLINRKQTTNEIRASDLVKKQCYIFDIKDAFRIKNKEILGNTWRGRGIESRLDFFLISNLLTQVCEYNVDHCFTSTDHSAIIIEIDLKVTQKFGPGIRFIDGEALKDVECKNKIIDEISREFALIPNDWNPNIKWDYIKMLTRQVMNKYTGKNFNQLENSVMYLEIEINNAIKYKQLTVKNIDNELNL